MNTDFEVQQMRATSVLSLMETDKAQRSNFIEDVINSIDVGRANVLDIHLQIKCMEQMTETLKKHPKYKEWLGEEAKKFGKTFTHKCGDFEVKTGRKTPNFSTCGDPVYDDLANQQAIIKNKLDERQAFLKSIPESGMEVLHGDELIRIMPPTYTYSDDVIAVTLK